MECMASQLAIKENAQGFWASLVDQLIKNPPAIWETWLQSLGWEDPLEKGKAIHSRILAWRIPWTVYCIVNGVRHDWATWASLVAQLVQNPPAVQETLVWFLDVGDLLEKG